MKESTFKDPGKPDFDYGQGVNLFAKIFSGLFGQKGSPIMGKWGTGNRGDTKTCQKTEGFIKKSNAKKKRKRRIAYLSKRRNRVGW